MAHLTEKAISETHTDLPAYSDTLGTWGKCHCKQIVTVSGEICISGNEIALINSRLRDNPRECSGEEEDDGDTSRQRED